MVNTDTDFSFQNTPLQNLKNILLEADSSAEEDKTTVPVNTLEGPGRLRSTGVLKSKLSETIKNLNDGEGQFISRADLGKIICKLCAQEDQAGSLNSKLKTLNININNIVNKLNLSKTAI